MSKYTILDSDEGMWLEQELEAMKTRELDVKYPDLMGRRLFPVDATTNEGAESVAYRSFDAVGVAKLIANGAKDLPSVNVKSKKSVKQLYSIGDSFEYTQADIRAARMSGMPLDSKLLSAARRAAMVVEDDLIFFGDADVGYTGIVNHPNIGTLTAPDGASTTTTWATKTSLEIVNDINLAVSQIVDGSNGVEAPTTMALPTAQYALIAQTPMSADNNVTILKFVLESNPYINEIVPVYKLKDSIAASASYDSEDCAVFYNRSIDKLWIELPMEFRAYTAQEQGLSLVVPCEQRTGGLTIAYPLSVCRLDGI